jgi:alpha-ketoglutarate-dependent taurine dioxygenase
MTAELPHILEPGAGDPADLLSFASNRHTQILEDLAHHGAVLLRGLAGTGVEALGPVAETLAPPLMEYQDRAAHRSQIAGHVYTSADYPPGHELFLHNEATYALRFPRRLFLHCITSAESGGETPIADSTKICARLAPDILRAFARRGVRYVRNFGTGAFGPTWQNAFQTTDRDELERYCRAAGIEFEWLDDERLRTKQTRPALIRHLKSGRPVWFNHAATLHVSTLPAGPRRTILKLFSEESYPCNTYYGDGATIEPAVLDAIRDAYRKESTTFEWQPGDLLVLDNLRVAHGRYAFKGSREVLAVLADPTDWTQVEVLRSDDIGSP